LIVTLVARAFAGSVEAKQRESLGRLIQLHHAAALYRFESSDRWPSQESVYESYLGFGEDYFVSPCANSPGYMKRASGISYMYLYTESREFMYEDFASSTPLFVDLDCNRTHAPVADEEKVGLAVSASGETIILKKKGDPRRWSWWVTE
jgi:hypothetical protein